MRPTPTFRSWPSSLAFKAAFLTNISFTSGCFSSILAFGCLQRWHYLVILLSLNHPLLCVEPFVVVCFWYFFFFLLFFCSQTPVLS